MKLNLATKFSALTAAILTVSFCTLGIFFIKRQKDIMFHDLEEVSVALVTNLSANSAYGLVTHDKNQLKSLLRSLSNVRDVFFTWIEDSSGEILAFYGNVPPGLYKAIKREIRARENVHFFLKNGPIPVIPFLFKKHIFGEKPYELLVASALVLAPDSRNKEALIFGQGAEAGKKSIVGRVVLALSLTRVDENLAAARNQSLWIVFIVASISILVTVLLVHVITKPLKLLKNATEQVMSGIIPSLIQVKSEDEIGELAQAFNKMVNQLMSGKKALEKAYGELEKANLVLEKRVAERTRALEESVSELTLARDELERAYHEMKNMYQAKEAFLRTASHELRTPLTAIKANIDYMWEYLRDGLDEESMEIVDAVRKNCNHMRSMVEDMLAMVRIDSDAVPLKLKKVNLKAMVIDAISELKGLQGDREIKTDVDESIEIECDPARIHDVFFNLLSNAYKFTNRDGQIRITARVIDEGLKMVIEDNGMGIPEKDLVHVFEPFYQAEHGENGSGLGLAIVQAAIKRHGGTIQCRSREGAWTKFTILLPLKQERVKREAGDGTDQ